MSISGSIPVVICLLLYVIQRENYNYVLGRGLLLTGVFFYLVPVQLIKYLLPKDALPETMLIGRKADSYLSGSLAFWSEKQGEYIWIPQWFNLFARIWLTGIIIFAIYEIVKYWRGAHSIRNYIFEKIENPEDNLTYYLIPDEICGPCTIGFFRQKIVFPESFPLHPDFIMVYKHEHTHLKNHDNLVKLLCLFVLCLHWMNPVAYLLLFLYIDTAEIVSDSAAVDGCTKEKRQDYASLLVLEASTSDGSIYDFGFEDMDDIAAAAIDFSQGDSIFVDSDGNQIVYQEESSDTYALCTHSMVPATFYTHSKNSSGGCTVKIYKCQRCEKCGYSANAVLQSTHTYVTCPH